MVREDLNHKKSEKTIIAKFISHRRLKKAKEKQYE